MPAKPNTRNWHDVQTVIASIAIVITLGMWDLFATSAKAETVPTQEPVFPPTELPVEAEPTQMPRIKIMFTPVASSQITDVVQQPQQIVEKKKKKKNNNNGGGGSVTQTQSS